MQQLDQLTTPQLHQRRGGLPSIRAAWFRAPESLEYLLLLRGIDTPASALLLCGNQRAECRSVVDRRGQ